MIIKSCFLSVPSEGQRILTGESPVMPAVGRVGARAM